jgi:hypothetical protein
MEEVRAALSVTTQSWSCKAGFHMEPRKSMRAASHELNVTRCTTQDVLRRCVRFSTYKIQRAQQHSVEDYLAHKESACLMLQNMDEHDDNLKCLVFCKGIRFRMNGYVNRPQLQCMWFRKFPLCFLTWKRKRERVRLSGEPKHTIFFL